MTRLPMNIHADAGAGLDPAAIPARPAVVVFEGPDARAVQVASTGDARAFVLARLGPDDPGAAPRADLRPVTARVVGRTVGSALEGDLACLELARERLPETYRALADRWRGWFVHLDPDAPAPTWRKTDLFEHIGEAPGGALIGPISDKDSAGRFGELLDDAFELCRFPKELARAPRGTACAYKEMGRCPAPCDGSEPMEAYRERARRAVAFGAGGPEGELARAEAEMRDAARAQDFERAASLKHRLEVLAKARSRPWAHAGLLSTLGVLAVLPAERFGRARLIVLTRLGLTWLADVDADRAREAWAELEPAVRGLQEAALGEGRRRLDAPWIERVGLLSRAWYRPKARGTRRRWELLDLRRWPEPRAVVRAVRAASAAQPGDDEHTERALGPDA